MTPERWQRVDKVLQAVLERPESQWGDFLASACSGDEALLREIESLLGYHQRATRFLETPAKEAALRALVEDEAQLFPSEDADQPLIGRVISHYRILKLVGGGNTGAVYQAQDTSALRLVALKFLPPGLGQSLPALEKFKQEALAVSALNHPNICAFYAIDQHDGQPYIVTEFLEGQSLKQGIAGKPLRIDEVLELSLEIVGALDAAHQKGIFHGDIKPSNIFTIHGGQVKMLDFGLSALMLSAGQQAQYSCDPGDAAEATVACISPEQVRGEDLDVRTDLFSFGAVLYEMATGRRAFSGATASIIIDAILNRTPISPMALNRELPKELIRIINQALQKDRALRFQTAANMLAHLKLLQAARAGCTKPELSPG